MELNIKKIWRKYFNSLHLYSVTFSNIRILLLLIIAIDKPKQKVKSIICLWIRYTVTLSSAYKRIQTVTKRPNLFFKLSFQYKVEI